MKKRFGVGISLVQQLRTSLNTTIDLTTAQPCEGNFAKLRLEEYSVLMSLIVSRSKMFDVNYLHAEGPGHQIAYRNRFSKRDGPRCATSDWQISPSLTLMDGKRDVPVLDIVREDYIKY